MSITLRVSDSEMLAIKNYAEMHGISVSDAVRRAIMDKIEDEIDFDIAKKAYAEWEADNKKTYSMASVQKELGF